MSHTTLVLAGVSSYISGNISFPFFIAKNATVTAYLLESSLARFKKSRLLFYSDKVFARIQIKNENIQLLLLGSLFVFSSVKERESSYSAKTFPRSRVACKTSKFVTKENSLLLPQTPWQSMR